MIPFSYDRLSAPQAPGANPQSWDQADRTVEALALSADRFKDFSPLREFARLRDLWAGGVNADQFECICRVSTLKRLVLRDIRVPDVSSLGRLGSLAFLALWGSVKTTSLAGLERLEALEFLAIEHVPRVSSLAPLRSLGRLCTLAIHSAIYYDASNKSLGFESLAPLAGLARLECLDLVGVRTRDESLAPLCGLKNLRKVHIGNTFPPEEFARLAAALPDAEGDCLKPCSKLMTDLPCKKCAKPQIMLTGKTRPQFVCPTCRKAALDRHVAAFERAMRGFKNA